MKEHSERQHRNRELELNSTVERYMEGLGVNWDDFSGKKVLDIGVDEGAFADAAKKRGIDIISIDQHRSNYLRFHRDVADKAPLVQGNASNLPFAENSFDMIISHAGPFDSDRMGFFLEAFRVLKKGGQLRIGRAPIVPPERRFKNLPENETERMAFIRQRSQDYAKDISKRCGFSSLEYHEHPKGQNGIIYWDFVFRK